MTVATSFLTDAARLERHMPEGFSLADKPVVTVEFHYLSGIDWLAGRGYTMVHVSWPTIFLAAVWENLADPIITGRDEIGHPKLYAEVAAPRHFNGEQICEASWMGFRFLELSVSRLVETSTPILPTRMDGTLMLKYKPRTGDWGEADLCQVTLTPIHDPHVTIVRREVGVGRMRFNTATWSDLPTMAHVVNALADLPVLELLGGSVVHARGGKSYRDQRVLS
jgi:hypothetical protein